MQVLILHFCLLGGWSAGTARCMTQNSGRRRSGGGGVVVGGGGGGGGAW